MTDITGYPSDMEGWGLVHLDNVLFFQGDNHELHVWDTRNSNGLTTGDLRPHLVDVQSNNRSLKVTLAWSDSPPVVPGVGDPTVNDLNLRVISPDGDGNKTYLGNRFENGFSVVGGDADEVNNVEQVLVNSPALGEWSVIVDAAEVGVPGQGYALVISNGRNEVAIDTSPPAPPTNLSMQ